MKDEETIFSEALSRASAIERDAYLQHACAGNVELRTAVEALLAAHQRAAGILEASPIHRPVADDTRDVGAGVGTIIGPYKLLEQLGGGGMGVVYMAEQTHPVRRMVALKVIKPGMDSGQVIARFEAERQALTMMDHPNIAKVLDAGTTDAGRPYFVMELVKGVPITDYCDRARLSMRDRLALFVTVCNAVQHAHQKGVIHRDLKPTNVLVTLHDDKPVPKVIDFGIAKAAGQVLTDKTLFTQFAQMLGTPLYMSPEQAELTGLDIDTRSDVYSLGVLLYELLTGTTPFEKQRLAEAAYDEMRRIIREEDPPNPSTRLSTMGEKLTAVSADRHTDPKRLGQLVRGELDWIVMKALEKDRARRYETANELGKDVERYLRDEAVQACPPSAVYRFRKFARRNKAVLAVAVALGVAVLLGIVGLLINNRMVTREKRQKEIALVQALHEKQRADENLVRARRAVNEYLMLAARNPLLREADFQALRRQLLESALPFYQEFVNQKTDDPALEVERGRAYGDLAIVREELGEFDQALAAHAERLAIFERLAADHSTVPSYRHEVANSYRNIGNVHRSVNRHESAEAAFRQAAAMLETLTAAYPSVAPYRQDLAGAYSNLGVLLRGTGRLDESLQLQQKGVALRERLAAEQSAAAEQRRDLAQGLLNLGSVFANLGRHDEALTATRRASELCRALADESPRTALYREMWGSALDNVSVLLCNLGRRDEGLVALEQALAVNEKLAVDFPSAPGYRSGLAESPVNQSILMAELGRDQDGLVAAERAVTILVKLVGEWPGVPQYRHILSTAYTNQADLHRRMTHYELALAALTKAVDLETRLVADDPTSPRLRDYLATSYGAMGENLTLLGRYDEAAASIERGIQIRETLIKESPAVLEHVVNLAGLFGSMGCLKFEQHQPEAAIQWFDKAIDKLSAVLASEPRLAIARRCAGLVYPNRATALNALGRHADALKDLDQALAFDDVENRTGIRLQRAMTNAKLRKHDEAVAEAEAVVALPELVARQFQDAAGVLADLAANLAHDPPLSERLAARAVALLGKAFEKDYRGLADGVGKDKDLDPLRTRDDYQKLWQHWAGKPK